ncbi:hypothetical protein L218DRAFT_1005963 [Marasmius fiardii PR-910]|nr:hypothetical protein L218DRAFT_1005963 [Marasmius fiardii PR-910]
MPHRPSSNFYPDSSEDRSNRHVQGHVSYGGPFANPTATTPRTMRKPDLSTFPGALDLHASSGLHTPVQHRKARPNNFPFDTNFQASSTSRNASSPVAISETYSSLPNDQFTTLGYVSRRCHWVVGKDTNGSEIIWSFTSNPFISPSESQRRLRNRWYSRVNGEVVRKEGFTTCIRMLVILRNPISKKDLNVTGVGKYSWVDHLMWGRRCIRKGDKRWGQGRVVMPHSFIDEGKIRVGT